MELGAVTQGACGKLGESQRGTLQKRNRGDNEDEKEISKPQGVKACIECRWHREY